MSWHQDTPGDELLLISAHRPSGQPSRDLEECLRGGKGAENGAKTFSTVGFLHLWHFLLQEDAGRLTASRKAEPCECHAIKCSFPSTARLRGGWPCCREPGQDTPCSRGSERGFRFPSPPPEIVPAPWGLLWSVGREGPSGARGGGLGPTDVEATGTTVSPTQLWSFYPAPFFPVTLPVRPPDKGVLLFLKKKKKEEMLSISCWRCRGQEGTNGD